MSGGQGWGQGSMLISIFGIDTKEPTCRCDCDMRSGCRLIFSEEKVSVPDQKITSCPLFFFFFLSVQLHLSQDGGRYFLLNNFLTLLISLSFPHKSANENQYLLTTWDKWDRESVWIVSNKLWIYNIRKELYMIELFHGKTLILVKNKIDLLTSFQHKQ